MSRSVFLGIALVDSIYCQCECFGDEPNVIVILADDFDWGDVSCSQPNGKVRTAAIDALASEGMRFTNAHASHSRRINRIATTNNLPS
jgi:hypothetical protein